MDNQEPKPPVPRERLVKRGISAVACLAGGAFLLVMTIGARSRFVGMVLPAAALVLGVGALLSKDRNDKKPGFLLCAAAVLGMLGRFGPSPVKPFVMFFLGLGALGLLAAGIWKGIAFLVGLKSRS